MVILAPMAGATDQAFRLAVKSFGCDLVVSEMVSAQGLLYDNEKHKSAAAFWKAGAAGGSAAVWPRSQSAGESQRSLPRITNQI